MSAMAAISVVGVDTLDIRVGERRWPFAEERRAEIDAHFAQRRLARPALFNGRILVLHRHTLHGGHFAGEAGATDFASFLAWRDWGFPDPSVRNFFAMGAVRGADGAFVLGVMGAHTANPGRVYFPAGTPDLDDVREGAVDLEGSIWRELHEETGLGPPDIDRVGPWNAVVAGPRIAFIKTLEAREPSDRIASRIRAHIAAQTAPELADIRLVRGPGDLDPQMPEFATAFLRAAWT